MVITLLGEGAMVRACADTYAAQWQSWQACWNIAWQQQVQSLLGAAAVRLGVLIVGIMVMVFFIGIAVARQTGFA
ncbi:hypothetical protein ACA910_022588, partial [Epithemia clementina (nom. ined.)]